MELRELPDKTWKSHEKKRFLKDDTKTKTDEFNPGDFQHDGFEDRERYVEKYVPALASEERLDAELNNFTPPRLHSINDSAYQTLVIRYGILRELIQEREYKTEKKELLESVQEWQRNLLERFDEDDFSDDDDLLHLACAGVDYRSELNDSELNMVHSYFELHNKSQDRKKDYYTWLDFFKRLSAIGRFPKISRSSDKPEHALDTIKQGLWSLQEQAIVYEVKDSDGEDIVGVPEDYVDYIRDWLYYEMSEDNFLSMLEEIDYFDNMNNLIDMRETFDLNTTAKTNQGRRENLARSGVFPSELLQEVPKEDLKAVVDEFSLGADKRKPSQNQKTRGRD